jgi:hypothetical protein
MHYYRQEGYFKETPEPYADLGEIVAGLKPGVNLLKSEP